MIEHPACALRHALAQIRAVRRAWASVRTEQVAGFFEIGMIGEVVNIDAAVR